MTTTAPPPPATAAGTSSAAPRDPSSPSRARRALLLTWPTALLLLGSVPLAAAWSSWTVVLLTALAAAVPLLVLRGVLSLGVSRWAAASVLALLLVLTAYLMTSAADLGLSQTVRDVVPRLLTSPRPYAPAPDLLAGPLLLTALVSLLVGLRVESRHRVEPLAGAALLYTAGLLLAGGRGDGLGLVAVLLLVVALLGWVLLDEHSEPVRPRLVVAAPLAVAGVGLLAASATLVVERPFEPRDLVDPPVLEVAASNPLTRLGAWAENPDAPLLRVRGPEVPLRLVTLDTYDGRQWTAATRVAPLGTGAPPGRALPEGTQRRQAAVEVELDGLGGNWLPTPGSPSTVSDREALVDPGTGSMYRPDADDGLVYEVEGSFDAPDEERLATAAVPPREEVARWTRLPERLPEGLVAYARQVASGAATPYEQAVEIEQQIRSDYALSARAISGSALWRLETFLVGRPGESGARIGTSEQFASAFAVVARYQGLPTRVVVGFRPGEPQEDGTRLVTGRDAFAWPEVYFDELGWVPFSPTPDDDTFRRDPPQGAEQQPDTLPPDQPTDAPTPTPTDGAGDDGGGNDPSGSTGAGPAGSDGVALPPTWVLATAGPAVTLAALALLLLGLRTLRRARQRRRGAVGAWAQVRDGLVLAGVRVAPHETATAVGHLLDTRLGGVGGVRLAARAERQAFAPAGDGDGGAGGAAGAGAGAGADAGLRAETRDVLRGLRGLVPAWRRWWWHLDPRVLVRR